MRTSIRAIETRYNGYRFRSRTEARWAVFFDTLRVPYHYEYQGFDLDGTRYLPDFWLPNHKLWIEIKGQTPSQKEEDKARLLATATDQAVYLFFGEIPMVNDAFRLECGDSAYVIWPDLVSEDGKQSPGGWDCQHWWCECPSCGHVGIEFQGRYPRLGCCAEQREAFRTDANDTNAASVRLHEAYTAARSARFEHGERGTR